MQNQIALYLIFISGALLILGAILNLDLLFGEKKEDTTTNGSTPLTGFSLKITNAIMKPFSALVRNNNDPQRLGKRVFYVFLGVFIIILGIIALNSGKFS